jgi:rhodanese-related sulfurtransferase
MDRQLFRHDLAWAGFILLLALVSGLMHQWQLVQLSWTGKLPVYLEAQQEKKTNLAMPGIKTLGLARTYELFQEKKALFVDARSAEEYAELHIPGAVHLTLELLKEKGAGVLPGIPSDREMVVYCSMLSCKAALVVAEKLNSLGFKQVSVFMGGFRAWDEAGYPADTGK